MAGESKDLEEQTMRARGAGRKQVPTAVPQHKPRPASGTVHRAEWPRGWAAGQRRERSQSRLPLWCCCD